LSKSPGKPASQENSKLKVQKTKSLVMGNPDFDFDLESRRRDEEILSPNSESQVATQRRQRAGRFDCPATSGFVLKHQTPLVAAGKT